MLVFRQLFDPQSSTYTYLLGDRASGAAVLIDPVFEQVRRDTALLGELGLKLVATLETHVHADHVTGAWLLKQRTGSRIMLAKASSAEGADRYLAQDDVVDVRRAAAAGARHARPYRQLPDLRARRPQHGVHRRLPADPRQRPDRFPAGRSGGDVPLGARADLYAARRLPAVPGARLSRADGDQRRRGAPFQPAPRRRDRPQRLRRLYAEPAAGASRR